MGYYPIVLDLTDGRCLVVGGGEVALRKVLALREAGANVTVVAPQIDPRILAVEGVQAVKRAYQTGDAAGCALVFAATGDRDANRHVSDDAREAAIPVNVVDDPELCTFVVPATLRRGDLLISVTTSGKSPALSARIRRELEANYGAEYAQLVDLMGRLRDEVKARYASQEEREAAFGRLITGEVLGLLREGRSEEAEARARQCI